MKKVVIILLITLLACSKEVYYQVSYDAMAVPSEIDELIIAKEADQVDYSGLKKKERRERLFESATGNYVIKRISQIFKSDTNFLLVRDTVYSSDVDSFIKGLDEGTFVLLPTLSMTKSDGFTMSSDAENKNYSTYYASLTVTLQSSNDEQKKTTIDDKVKVEGDELMLVVDVFSEQDYNFSSEIKEMLRSMAKQYHRRWYPRIETFTKTAYVRNKFKGFDTFFNKGNYKKAREIVSPYLTSNNLTLQMQASYNMHLICEATSDAACSNKWLANYEKCQKKLQEQWNR